MLPLSISLAQALKKTLVIFDLEHTGGFKETQRITEFGAITITPDGETMEYSSLVKPPEGTYFEPFVSRKTGIWPVTVAQAPAWDVVMNHFVIPRQQALWVGFSSRSSDMPLIELQNEEAGVRLPTFEQLDLLKFGGLKGSLSSRVEQVCGPQDAAIRAHRALDDSRLTLMLLEGLMQRGIDFADLIGRGAISLGSGAPTPAQPKNAAHASALAPDLDPDCFLVQPGQSRGRAPWAQAESAWVTRAFHAARSIEDMASAVGRTPFALACWLYKAGLIDEATRNNYQGRRDRHQKAS